MKSPFYALCKDGKVIGWYSTIGYAMRAVEDSNRYQGPGHYQHNATHPKAPEFVRNEYARIEAPKLARFDPVI